MMMSFSTLTEPDMTTPRIATLKVIAACALALIVTGCDRAETPSETRADVSAARDDGIEKVGEARRDAARDVIDAQQNVDQASSDMMRESAEGARDVAVVEAEAAHQISTARCDAMTGEPREACRKEADDQLDLVKKQID